MLLWCGCLRGRASCYNVVGEVLGVIIVSDDVAGVVTGAVAVGFAVGRIRKTEV